jgi:hypothetical protein
MLLEDLRIAPAAMAIEFGDQLPRDAPRCRVGQRVLESQAIDPVLIAVERQQASVRHDSEGFGRAEDHIGGQAGIMV